MVTGSACNTPLFFSLPLSLLPLNQAPPPSAGTSAYLDTAHEVCKRVFPALTAVLKPLVLAASSALKNIPAAAATAGGGSTVLPLPPGGSTVLLLAGVAAAAAVAGFWADASFVSMLGSCLYWAGLCTTLVAVAGMLWHVLNTKLGA